MPIMSKRCKVVLLLLRGLRFEIKELNPSVIKEINKELKNIEKQCGKKFGDLNNPLLVSVRSGARVSMPGMMDTILNLGLNDQTVLSLGK